MAHAEVLQDEGLAFFLEDGSSIHREPLSRTFDRLAAAAGLPRIGVHGVRHSYATAALSAGAPIKVVSERLGHASVTITLDTYAHVLPSHMRRWPWTIATLILGSATCRDHSVTIAPAGATTLQSSCSVSAGQASVDGET